MASLAAAIVLALPAGAFASGEADGAARPGLIDLATVAPRVRLEIRYATSDNFTRRRIYAEARCRLRPAVAVRLARVAAALEREGYGLKVFDCYRPLAAQRLLWSILPDERYVADPRKGSRHNRGAAVDLTLVDARGRELDMGTAWDAFGPRAHRDAEGLSRAIRSNRARLDRAMKREGFIGLRTEWWHFDASDWERYPIE